MFAPALAASRWRSAQCGEVCGEKLAHPESRNLVPDGRALPDRGLRRAQSHGSRGKPRRPRPWDLIQQALTAVTLETNNDDLACTSLWSDSLSFVSKVCGSKHGPSWQNSG